MSWLEPFRDSVVLVTGASSGIGRATALAFAHGGAHVAVAARRKSLLDELAAQAGRARRPGAADGRHPARPGRRLHRCRSPALRAPRRGRQQRRRPHPGTPRRDGRRRPRHDAAREPLRPALRHAGSAARHGAATGRGDRERRVARGPPRVHAARRLLCHEVRARRAHGGRARGACGARYPRGPRAARHRRDPDGRAGDARRGLPRLLAEGAEHAAVVGGVGDLRGGALPPGRGIRAAGHGHAREARRARPGRGRHAGAVGARHGGLAVAARPACTASGRERRRPERDAREDRPELRCRRSRLGHGRSSAASRRGGRKATVSTGGNTSPAGSR